MKGSVSVIIPFFNRVDWLIEAVESVLKQTYKADEIIVVNDGSNEDVGIFLDNYGEKIIYIKTENNGPASARNKGIEVATSEYVAFLDSDDIWESEKLEKQIPIMIKEKAIWSHTSYKTFLDENPSIENIKLTDELNGFIYPKILSSCRIATPCVVIRRDILNEDSTLRFNNTMRYGEDGYLWINLSLKYKVIAISEPLTKVRIRGSNAALRAKVQIKSRSIIWDIIKNNKEKYCINEIPTSIKFAYEITNILEWLIRNIEKIVKSDCYIEYISKILYVFPWMIFKFNYK